MPNFFLIQPNGHKQGPISEERLKELAAQGIIEPNTSLETESGHRGTAGQIPGLVFHKAQSVTPNYFIIDAKGQRQGPFDEQQLKTLASNGNITPTTPMETDTGHKGVAGQIPGLFPRASSMPSSVASVATKGKELAQQGMAEFSKGAGEVMVGFSAAKAAAQAGLRLKDLNQQLVTAFRALGDAAEQVGWGGELCESIRKQKNDVASVSAWYGKAATDAELAKNTPGAGAAKQALAEAKQQMMLTTGVLDGLREKAGQMLMGDTTAPSSIGAPQREEIKRLLGEIAQCQNAVMVGKTSLLSASKPMLKIAAVAAVILLLIVGLWMFFGGFSSSHIPFLSALKNAKPGDWARYEITFMDEKETITFEVLERTGTIVTLRVAIAPPKDIDEKFSNPRGNIGRNTRDAEKEYSVFFVEIDLSKSLKKNIQSLSEQLERHLGRHSDYPIISAVSVKRGWASKGSMLVAGQNLNCVVRPYTVNVSAVNGTTAIISIKEWSNKKIPVTGLAKYEWQSTIDGEPDTSAVNKPAVKMTLIEFGSAK